MKKRADARAETLREKETAEKALEDYKHASEVQKVEAAKANFESHGTKAKSEKALTIAEAEEAIAENAYTITCSEAEKARTEEGNPSIVPIKETSESDNHDAITNNFKNTEKSSQTLRCSICRKTFPDKSKFDEHKRNHYKDGNNKRLKVKCPLCSWELPSCKDIMDHIEYGHKRNLNWIAKEYN